MLALYIVGGIILLIVILLNCPASVFLKYEDGQFSAKVKYLFFTLYPMKKKEEASENEAAPAEEKEDISEEEKPEKQELLTVREAEKELLALSEEDAAPAEKDEQPISKEEQKALKKKEKLKAKKEKKREKLRRKREKLRKREELRGKIELVKRLIASSGKGLKRILKGIKFKGLYLKLDIADEDAAECAIKYGKIGAAVYDGLSFLRTFFTVTVEKIELNCRYYTDRGDCTAMGTIALRPATVINAALGIGMKFLILTIKEKIQKGKEDSNERASNSGNDGNNNGKNTGDGGL